MGRFSIGFIVALALSPSPATAQVSSSAQAQVGHPCAGLREWVLIADGVPADDFVARLKEDDALVRDFIEMEPPRGLGIDLPTEELQELIAEINEDPSRVEYSRAIPEQLLGFGGFSSTLLLTKLLLDVHPVLYGKIRDYVYDDKRKSGHLGVDVCVDQNQFFHWDVDVAPGGYKVHFRSTDPADYPANPFPSVDLKLPEMATKPGTGDSVWDRGLEHKLHAKGDSIVVGNVYYRGPGSPGLMRLPDGHRFYDSTDESCIDLFTQPYPPATFGELVGNDFCLGRCEHPGVINTGG